MLRWGFAGGWLTIAFVVLAWLRIRMNTAHDLFPGVADVLFSLRAQSVAIITLVGAALSLAGLLMQGLFRNPLADPGILGVGAGANLGGMFALSFGEALAGRGLLTIPRELYVATGCIVGAFVALLVLLLVMRRTSDFITVLLAGVALTVLLGSVGAVFRAIVADRWELARAMLNFSMGDIEGKGSRHLRLAAPLVVAGAWAAYRIAPNLDVLSSGEDEAATLGVDVDAVRLWTVIWTALLVAAAVSVGGGIPFLGLLVPHLMRGCCGSEHRRLVPLVVLGGAVLLLACDCLSVAIDTKCVVPLGGITGLIGAPAFFLLLLRHRLRGA